MRIRQPDCGAASKGVALHDTGADVLAITGKPISDIFVTDGEPRFRELEPAALVIEDGHQPRAVRLPRSQPPQHPHSLARARRAGAHRHAASHQLIAIDPPVVAAPLDARDITPRRETR